MKFPLILYKKAKNLDFLVLSCQYNARTWRKNEKYEGT